MKISAVFMIIKRTDWQYICLLLVQIDSIYRHIKSVYEILGNNIAHYWLIISKVKNPTMSIQNVGI